MEDKTFMIPPIGGKSILRSTGEEVEIIDFEIKERGLPEHSNQLMICISTAKNQASLRYRRKNSKHQELFNFMSINPTRKIIKIVRIGAGLSDVNVLDIVGVRFGDNPQII